MGKQVYCSNHCRFEAHPPPALVGNQHAVRPDSINGITMRWRARKIFGPLFGIVCVKCGEPAQLVHHKDEDYTNNDKDNLEPQCRSCHLKHHNPSGWASLASPQVAVAINPVT